MIKNLLELTTIVLLLSSCDNNKTIPDIDNLNDSKEMRAAAKSGSILAEGKPIKLQDYWDNYCIGNEAHPMCMKLNKALKMNTFHRPSVTGQN